jgi:hypothetical protein
MEGMKDAKEAAEEAQKEEAQKEAAKNQII